MKDYRKVRPGAVNSRNIRRGPIAGAAVVLGQINDFQGGSSPHAIGASRPRRGCLVAHFINHKIGRTRADEGESLAIFLQRAVECIKDRVRYTISTGESSAVCGQNQELLWAEITAG